jgi:hypothetical protein
LRFSLNPQQLAAVRLGPGVPSWPAGPRVYLDWWDDAASALRTFNLLPRDPWPFWQPRRQSVQLLAALEAWRTNPEDYPEAPPAIAALPAPAIAEVTSRSPRSVVAFTRFLMLSFWNAMLSGAICIMMQVSSGKEIAFICAIPALFLLTSFLPFWMYKEPKLEESPNPPAQTLSSDTQPTL